MSALVPAERLVVGDHVYEEDSSPPIGRVAAIGSKYTMVKYGDVTRAYKHGTDYLRLTRAATRQPAPRPRPSDGRTPVEALRIGDVVKVYDDGKKGVVYANDRPWTKVRYGADNCMAYRHDQESLILVERAPEPKPLVERIPAEEARVGDTVKGTENGPVGVVAQTSYGWTLVSFPSVSNEMSFKHGLEKLILVKRAPEPEPKSDEGMTYYILDAMESLALAASAQSTDPDEVLRVVKRGLGLWHR